MKIRFGFQTNSSSTSFYFIFKGGKINLYEKLVKYKDYFNLNNEFVYGDINVWDVIQELEVVMKSHPDDLWIKPEIQDIDKMIEKIQEDVKYYHSDVHEWASDRCKKWQQKLDILQKCKGKGLTSIFQIGFGDNDGEISGGAVGTTMDYEGRKINIIEDDFAIITEQNR